MNIPIKAIEVPQWWKETTILEEKYTKQLSKLIGTDLDMVKKQKKEYAKANKDEQFVKKLEFITAIIKKNPGRKYTQDEENQDKILNKIISGLNEYKWGRFRLENIHNNFGTAPHLYYDEDKEIIEIKEI